MPLAFFPAVLLAILPLASQSNISQDGGYSIAIRFSQDLEEPPDCFQLFKNLELVFNTLSHSVYAVGGRRLYIREVEVILPTFWKCKSTPYRSVSGADFIVGPSGDEPFMRSGEICTKSGDFIALPLPYLLNVVDDATYIWNLVIQWLKFTYLPVGSATRQMFCQDDGAAIYQKMLQHQDYLRSEEKDAIRATRFKYTKPLVETRTELMNFSVTLSPSGGCKIKALLRLDELPVIGALLKATVQLANEQREILLTETDPGTYWTSLENLGTGNYSVSVGASDDGNAHTIRIPSSNMETVECCGWFVDPAEEEYIKPTGTFSLTHPDLWCTSAGLLRPDSSFGSGASSTVLCLVNLLPCLLVFWKYG